MADNDPVARLPQPFLNPYLAGLLLGLTLLASFLILGAGLGASAGLARLAAFCQICISPEQVLSSEYFGSWGATPLRYYLVFMLAGTFMGGLLSAWISGRQALRLERGAACPKATRAVLAIVGGVLSGFASRLAQGCTSGQALTGSALLLTGSIIYLCCVFAGGYAAAWFFRSQWYD